MNDQTQTTVKRLLNEPVRLGITPILRPLSETYVLTPLGEHVFCSTVEPDVRRLLNQIEKAIAAALQPYLFRLSIEPDYLAITRNIVESQQ